MRARDAVIAGILLCSCGVHKGDSFFLSSSSCWTAAPPPASGIARRRSSTPHHHVTARRARHTPPPRQYGRSTRISNSCVAEDTESPASQQQKRQQEQRYYTAADLERLSRRELQALCKNLHLRAVGKTSELVSRLLEIQQQDQQRLHHKASSEIDPTPPPVSAAVSDATDEDDAIADDVDVAASTRTADVPSAVEVGSGTKRSTGEEGEPGAGAAAAPETSAADFLLEDVRPVFDELSDEQWAKVGQLGQLLTEWNGKINLISRKDIANVMRRHVVPCLAMAKALDFEDGIYVLDVGTGGGLPGLPLAICYPKVKFTLIDGTGKKIAAVADMAERLGLANVRTFHIRAEEVHEPFDFVMGRAVTNLPKFIGFIDKNLKPNDPRANDHPTDIDDAGGDERSSGNSLRRGVLYMRGEVSEEELAELGAQPSTVIPLQRVLEEAGQGGDVGLGGDVNDRGYSSVFHFTSEAIWNRMPIASGPGEHA